MKKMIALFILLTLSLPAFAQLDSVTSNVIDYSYLWLLEVLKSIILIASLGAFIDFSIKISDKVKHVKKSYIEHSEK